MSEPKKLSELSTIKNEDVKDALISGLRSRPNAKSLYGAKGLTAEELKKQYDKYPEILRQHFNEIVEAIVESLKNDDGNGSKLAEEIMVIVSEPDSLPIYTDNLKNAIQVIIGDIKKSLSTANEARINAGAARLIAGEAEITADEARNIADAAENTANEARNIADAAEITADEARNIADAAESTADVAQLIASSARLTANDALSIAKGANRAETFDNVDQMNAWITARKEEVESDIVTGKTFPAGTTLIYSVDDKPEVHWFSEHPNAGLTVNGDSFLTRAFLRQGRIFILHSLNEDTHIESFEAEIFYSKGTEQVYCTENPRLTYVEGSVGDINYDLIKSHNIAVGTNLYIRDIGVPDYWWDGAQAQELETQKVDLKDYAKSEEVKAGLQLILDAVNSLSGGEST
jgi:hypothetical protein